MKNFPIIGGILGLFIFISQPFLLAANPTSAATQQLKISAQRSSSQLQESSRAGEDETDSQDELDSLQQNQVIAAQTVERNTYSSDATGVSRPTHETQRFFSRGRLVRQIDIFLNQATGAPHVKIESLFDSKGRLSTQKIYDASGRRVLQMKFKYDSSGRIIKVQRKGALPSGLLPDPTPIVNWLSANQASTATGLPVSHPDDAKFIYHEGIVAEWAKIYANTQAYTYNSALAGIAMLDTGNPEGAKEIFDFYYSEFEKEKDNFSGFWTVYNVDPDFQWKRYEYRKGMGENAWLGIFCLWIQSKSTDAVQKQKASELSLAIARWIATLPHHEGAVAMGPDRPETSPNFGEIYSTENMLDYYKLLTELLEGPLSDADRSLFTSESSALKNWLSSQAYDRTVGLFRRGGKLDRTTGIFEWDPIFSMDKESWGIAAIGPEVLARDFGIDLNDLASRTAVRFGLQDNNLFGGEVFLSKGFDFSDAFNAQAIGRSGMKWVEGTNQMVLAYRLLAKHYASSNPVQSGIYSYLADLLSMRNIENIMVSAAGNAYVYADKADIQIYDRTGNWKTFVGRSVASTAWVYFGIRGLNPFEIG